MPIHVCTTCAAAYPPSDLPPTRCIICDEERQYVNADGQQWTTMDVVDSDYRVDIRAQEPGLDGICTTPQLGIGQRALFIQQPGGGVVWDLTPAIPPEAVAHIQANGGVRAIAVSHPHFYGTCAEWSRRLEVPVYLHADDRQWAAYPAENTVFWSGERRDLGQGITLVRCGGHFAGSTVLHWAGGADGRGVLMTGDTVMVTPDPRWLSFMRSYPILIPLNGAKVRHIVDVLDPLPFDRIYGGWWDRVCVSEAKARLHASAERYISAIAD